MSYIANHPKRVISGLTTVLVAAGVAVGSGASFTSNETANPSNIFTSGTLSMTNDKNVPGQPARAILSASNLKPGDQQTGVVTIANTGSIDGRFTLTEITNSNTFSAGKLKVIVQDVTGGGARTVVGSTDVGSVPPSNVGTIAPSSSRTYRFTVTLDPTTGNADQNKTASVEYRWNAIQGDPIKTDSDTGATGATGPVGP